ncbi:RDH8 [Symbiodinium microadriaticum]|nr:RDH8 [Symbiodinium microadriaticum]
MALSVKLARNHLVFAGMRSLAKRDSLLEAATKAEVSGNVRAIEVDVNTDASVENGLVPALKEAGRVDVLVNNAGYSQAGSVEMLAMEAMKAQMETNLYGVIRCQKAVLPFMRQQKAGKIINISSVGGIWGQPFNDIYCASKFALEGLTESQAALFRTFGVHVSCVEPGAIKSAFWVNAQMPDTSVMPAEYQKPLQSTMGAYGKSSSVGQTPDEVADVIIEQIINAASPPVRVQTNPSIQKVFEQQLGQNISGEVAAQMFKLFKISLSSVPTSFAELRSLIVDSTWAEPAATEYVGFLEEVKAISWPPRGGAQTHQETLADQKCPGISIASAKLVGLTAMLAFSGLRNALVICIAAVLVSLSAAQTDVVTPWVDVCTSEDFSAEDREELCPATFVVSTLAYNPLYPGSLANITIILQPSRDLPSSIQRTQYIDFNLVGFEAVGTQNTANALIRDLEITAGNTVPLGVDPLFGYNTQQNPLFTTPALYNLNSRLLRLTVRTGQSLLAGTDTEVTICCMRLPTSSPQDFSGYTISGPTSLDTLTSINEEPILNSPEIDPGLQWEFLRVAFAPPVSSSLTIIHLTIRPANPLTDRARIILSMPLVQRENNVSGEVNFNTASSLDGADWMFFESRALWDAMEGKLTFFIREGRVLDRQVTLSTEPDEFRLPIELEADSPTLEVSARSFDNIDEVVRETPVTQSSAVPHVRNFTFSRLMYSNNMPNQMSSVMFHFSTNRPLFAGSVVYLRLSGFTSQRVQVPVKGTTKANFREESAVFNIPENEIELHVVRTLYSDEYLVQVELTELILPPALYANDTSLLVWNSDPGAPRQPVDDSPMVGMGDKTFRRSQLAFDPAEPRLAANVSFTLEPTIVFYQGDSIVIHMYGFACTLTSIPLLGADAFRIENQAASWTQEDSMLVFTVAENEIISNAMPFRVSIGRDSVFRLPDKLSENDGILRIEGKGALIDLEPIKKIPKVGTDKFVIESIVEFEPEDSSINAFTRISFSLVLNTDVLPNSTMYIKLGGLVRDPGRTNLIGVQGAARSGTVKISGANGPLFRNEEGYWDQDMVLLTVQMVSTVQIFAGERVRFFIERDQDFKLPYSAYQSDPSFRLAVPEAGIPERPFQFSTRVSQEGKLFIVSEIYYGSRGAVAYPNTVVEFNFWFRPNVNLPAGTTVRLKLPGFTCPFTDVPIGTQEVPVSNAYDLSDFIRTGIWDQLAETFDLVVPIGQQIYRQQPTVLRIMESSGFRLPATPLLPNDPSLTIRAIGNVVIFEEPIKTSPRVVDRSFMVSEFIYAPPQQDSIFQLKMILQPTVNITEDNDIIIFLPCSKRMVPDQRIVAASKIDFDGSKSAKVAVLAMLRPGGPRYRRTRWLRILALCFMTFQVRGFVLGALSRGATRSVGLQAADSDKNFNKQKFLRRPEFDPLSLQDFRREALLQYSNTNQSEPLRILIFLFVTICGLFSPTFFPSNAGPPFFVAAATVTLASGFLFLRERGKRTAQLVRLEREYSIGDLSVELSEPVSGRSESKELQALRDQYRLVALFGSFDQLVEALRAALPYRRRFEQSRVLVLAVSATLEDSDKVAFAAFGSEALLRQAGPWLAKAKQLRRWRSYFEALAEDKNSSGDCLWVGLNFRGRVFGSDFGCPIWDEVLAAMPPIKRLSSLEERYALADAASGALEAQEEFYRALCEGDKQAMAAIFDEKDDAELTTAIQVDGQTGSTNLSLWEVVLAPENRPELRTASSDCVSLSKTSSITTCIEFPVLGPTLLATQTWTRNDASAPWRLQSHRSIPYAMQIEARVALRCDHRGCIAFGKQLDAMPGFRNSLAKVNIHIMGEDRFRIDNSMGYWNETTARLRLSVPLREVIPAFTMMDLRIEESQGFLLPAALNANDTSLTIQSVNNIQEEPIKTSPMVGNGPFAGHMFCMYQYEVGTRSPSPICATALDCNPPLTDPCNPQELLRCGCDARVDEVFPMSILGFNLQQEDSVHFLPNQQRCSFDLIGNSDVCMHDLRTRVCTYICMYVRMYVGRGR